MDPTKQQRPDGPPGPAETAAGFIGLEIAGTPAIAEPKAPAPAVTTAVRWLTEKKREADYTLEFPLEIDGVEVRTVTARRMTGGQVASLMERMRAEPEKVHRWPMFFVGDVPLSDAAWDALDDDDRFALTEIAEGFLPARFRSRLAEPTGADAS